MDATAFLADEMLGSLARLLRHLGLDVELARDATDEGILDRLREDPGRILLTRDVALSARARRAGLHVVLVRSLDRDGQAREVVAALGLAPDPARVLTRCGACNALLRGSTAKEQGAAPAGARPPFLTCPRCERIYWEGSHAPRIRATLERILRDGPPPPNL